MTVRLSESRPDALNYSGRYDVEDYEGSVLVFVEGSDDQWVVKEVIDRAGKDDVSFQIHSMGGKDRWGPKLSVVSDVDAFRQNCRAIGLIMDADTKADSAEKRCRQALRIARLPCPAPNSSLITKDRLTVGVLVMPPGAKSGCLEDLVLAASGAPERVIAAEKYLEELSGQVEVPGGMGRSKAVLQAYLGAQPKVYKTLVAAIRDSGGMFNWLGEVLEPVREFVLSLAEAAAR